MSSRPTASTAPATPPQSPHADGRILAIESSCDETAAAVVDLQGTILSNVVASQHDTHAPFGGVVPELAARRHIEAIDSIAQRALREAHCSWKDLSAVAVTQGPGLAGALLVGVNYAKACAYALKRPLLLVNHLEGHIASAWLAQPDFPRDAVVLVVSGGHTHLYRVHGPSKYTLLGRTVDDAAGEAFDKAAKLLGLGYPGGPAIDRLARGGRPDAIRFPRARRPARTANGGSSLNVSFSGLKTSLLYFLRDHPEWKMVDRLPDLTASFQEAIVDVLVDRAVGAVKQTGVSALAVVGGVSANSRLRTRMTEMATREGIRLSVPPVSFCTDNAAMVAAAGLATFRAGRQAPLDAESAADLPIAGLTPASTSHATRTRRPTATQTRS
ncbi:MAG: tRNA (adenosine(37)-N6)-threonylcarbamoyltransferase complex transferase subunit TsaD [Nitrospiraceae bacterium]